MADGSRDIAQSRVKTVRIVDLFCGAGGLSTGAKRALREMGMRAELTAVNHWPLAIETHSRNHPDAIHFCADLETARPLGLVPGGRLDLLIAAPTCTFHSRARGGRPVNDQQRMDPWHVVRWCTELRVKRLLIENVPEFVEWGPCSLVTGRPIASRRGEYFRAWCEALRAIGFRIDYRILCCADYGDATTRTRFFMQGAADGHRIEWPEPTHAQAGSIDLFGERLPWRPAAKIIDWGTPGTSIFTRKRPLRPNTLRRILSGAVRYGWPKPYLEALQALMDGRQPVLEVSGALDGDRVPLTMATASCGAARTIMEPLPTVVTTARPHFVEPILIGADDSLLAPYYGSGSGLTSRPVSSPLPTITTKARFGLAQPLVVELSNSSSASVPRSVAEPLKTITTAKGGDKALAAPIANGHRIDILYRMLHWRELSGATSFDDEGETYDFAGNTTEITKQIGNAVPGRTAKALVRALLTPAA